jgi:hypothetical protein
MEDKSVGEIKECEYVLPVVYQGELCLHPKADENESGRIIALCNQQSCPLLQVKIVNN